MSVYSNFMLESDGILSADIQKYEPGKILDDMEKEEVKAAHEECSYEAALRCCAENTMNWNAIMKAATIQEFCYLEETGTEMVYTEATGNSFFESVKAFFRKIWEKIQSIFKKVLMQFASWSKNDKEFLNKYRKDIVKISTGGLNGFNDVEIKWYPYVFIKDGSAAAIKDRIDTAEKSWAFHDVDTSGDGNAAIKAFVKAVTGNEAPSDTPDVGDSTTNKDAWQKIIKDMNEDDDKIQSAINKYRGALCGSTQEIEANEFSKEIAEYFQGGESSKDTKNLHEVIDDALAFLAFSDKARSEVGKLLSTNKKSIDTAIKNVEKYQKTFSKGAVPTDKNEKLSSANYIAGAKHSICNKHIAALKQQKNILTTYNGAALQHLKACSRQCKAACIKAATFVPKHESADMFQTESDMSLLAGIEMI